MVAFCEAIGKPIQLLYYPPYHRKYTPIERCWGILELHWNGTKLVNVETMGAWAKSMSRFEILEHHQYKHDFAPVPSYRKVTAKPAESEAKEVMWERPILHAKIQLDNTRMLDLINVHLQSRLPTDIPGQKVNNFTWQTSSARRVNRACFAPRKIIRTEGEYGCGFL
jgi:hypothetical protein